VFITGSIAALTLGSSNFSTASIYIQDDFISNLVHAESIFIVEALFSGMFFNIGNILIIKAVEYSGLAVAFPIGVGTALVIGTILTYIIQKTGNIVLIAVGLTLCVIAISCVSMTYKLKE